MPAPEDESPELRVLLMSPLAGRDPESGDLAYTQALLEHPPPGVRYTTYAEALEAGLITIRGRRPRHGRVTPTDVAILGLRVLETSARGRIMFREPYWWVTMREDSFDLVHQHLFALRQVGARVPAISSAGYPLSVMYGVQEGWSSARASRAERLDRALSRLLGVHNPGLWAPPDDVLTVYTDHFRQHVRATSATAAPVLVCGQGLPELASGTRRPSGVTVGFVGRDFRRKGGHIAVAAFRRLRRMHPALKMVLVTRVASVDRHLLPAGIQLITDAPRELVTSELLQQIDIMMLPTEADCGAPYGVIEALRAGVPVVTSELPWLDARLRPPAVHRVPRTVAAVADAVGAILDPPKLEMARAAARDLWRDEFSMRALHRQLLQAYGCATRRSSVR